MFFHNWTLNLSVYINRHCIRLCTWTQSWDTSDSNFRRPFWPPSWKICNWCYWFLHILILRPSLYMNRHFICFCIQKESWDTLNCNFRRPSWPPSWKICNWCYWFLHIHILRPSLFMNRHFICLCIHKESWDTLDCNFRRPSWPPSWKICNWCYWFLHIHTCRPSFYMNRHFICICIWKESWDTWLWISAAILAAILENMQPIFMIFTKSYSTTFILYESTLYLSLYSKGELRYIRL